MKIQMCLCICMHQGSYREVLSKIQGLFKTILQFSGTESLGKILIEVLNSSSKKLD